MATTRRMPKVRPSLKAHARASPSSRKENVPETVDVQKTMESMINLDGATLIFPTSFGYFDPHMLAMAAKYPDIQFRHCGGLWQEGKNPTNTGSYFGYIGQGQYLNGIAAGHTSKSKKIGFVAAKPIPQVLQNINAFLLGARSVDPTITCQVIFTGEWSLAVKEAEATNALIDQGADVITCHVDSPKVVVETAAGRGAFVCGYHANQSPLAPEKYLTGAEWAWGNVYNDFVKKAQAGEKLGNFVRGGLKDGFVKMSPLGPAVPARRPQEVRRHAGRDDERQASPSSRGRSRTTRATSSSTADKSYRRGRDRAREHGLSRRRRRRIHGVSREEKRHDSPGERLPQYPIASERSSVAQTYPRMARAAGRNRLSSASARS